MEKLLSSINPLPPPNLARKHFKFENVICYVWYFTLFRMLTSNSSALANFKTKKTQVIWQYRLRMKIGSCCKRTALWQETLYACVHQDIKAQIHLYGRLILCFEFRNWMIQVAFAFPPSLRVTFLLTVCMDDSFTDKEIKQIRTDRIDAFRGFFS